MNFLKMFGTAVAALFISQTLLAAQAGFWTTVTSVASVNGQFGGCHASISPGTDSKNLSCASPGYVSFNCDAERGLNSKSQGQTLFAIAQLGLVTGKSVYVVVNDEEDFDGICYAYSSQVTN